MAKTMERSILARSLMTGAASLAFMMMGPAGVRADIVIVQGDDAAPPVAALTRPNGAPAALSTWEVSQVPHTAGLPASTMSGRRWVSALSTGSSTPSSGAA